MQNFLTSLVSLLSVSPVIYLSGVIYTSAVFKWMRTLIKENKARSEWFYIIVILINGLIPTIVDAFSVDLFNRVNPALIVIGVPILAVLEFSFISRDSLRIYIFLSCLLMLQLACIFGFAASFITYTSSEADVLSNPSLHTSVLTLTLILLAASITLLRRLSGDSSEILRDIIHDDLYGSMLHFYMVMNGLVLGVTTGVDYSIYFAERTLEAFRSNVLTGMTLRYLLIMITSFVIIYVQCKMEIGRRRAMEVTMHLDREKKRSEKLEKKASTDALTGLQNRSGMVNLIKDALEESEDDDVHALFMLDLDHFKEVNDNFGHPVGDELLIKAANAIRGAFRDNDIVGRLGGDEFSVLMRSCSIDVARRKAEYLNEQIQYDYSDGKVSVHTTVSIGVAMYPECGKDYDTLYGSADRALYTTKENGRNGNTVLGNI